MFIDWLPEVLRPWRTRNLRSKRAVKSGRVLAPVSAAVETLEQLTLLAATPIFPLPPTNAGQIAFDQAVYSIGETVTIGLQDLNLAGTGSLDVQVFSSAGDFETVHLTEEGSTGRFTGVIVTKNSEAQGFVVNDGLLEIPRASAISISYSDADDGTGSSKIVSDSANLFVFSDVQRFDFSNTNGTPSNEGFATIGQANQWHVSNGRGVELGHSSSYSFYFGQGETLGGGGTYIANANGTLFSPEIDLGSYTGPVLLTFNTYLDLEDVNDTATVSVVTSSGTTDIASNNGALSNLPDATGGFQQITLDLSAFAGQKISLAFNLRSNATTQREGWYVDDIAVKAPLATITGTVYDDTNGNGQQNLGEFPLPGATVFIDANNDGLLGNVVNTVTNSTSTPIPDLGQITSTVNVGNVVGSIVDVNVNLSINHTRDADLDVFLISPSGTRIELFTDVGGIGQNFNGTTFDDQAGFSINLGTAPFSGTFSPEGLLASLIGENPNGVWKLEVNDDSSGQTGTLLNWSISITTLESSAVTDANGQYVLAVPVGGAFNIRQVLPPGRIQTNPTPVVGDPNPAQPVTVPFGGIVPGVDFYSQYILPTITLPNGPATYTENQLPVAIDSGAILTDPNSLNFNNGSLVVSLTANSTADDRLSISSQGFGTGQIGVIGNQVYYQGTNFGTFVGGTGSDPLIVVFNASATPAAVQALLRNVRFQVIGDNPSGLTRTVQFDLSDGVDGTGAPVSKQINVIPVNDPPLVTVTNTPITYLENGPPQPVDILATVTDSDSLNFGGGYLQVSILGNESGPSVTTQYTINSANSPVTLNNNTIQAPLIVAGINGRLSDVNVTVNINHTNDPDLTAYLIGPNGVRVKLFSNVGVNSSGFSVRNFTNTTFDDESFFPILSGAASAPFTGSFQPEKELYTLDGQNPNGTWYLELTDATGSPVDGTGSLISWSLGLTTIETSVNEKLAILDQGQGAGSIGVSGNRITYGGVVIGTFTGGVGSSPLLVSFNANATPAAVQSLMQNITIEIQGENPILGLRRVEYIVNDGDGGTSIPAERLINVQAVNDAPVLTLPAGMSAYVEGAQPTVLDTFATVTDVDSVDFNGGILTVSLGATGQATDRLGIRSSGQGVGQISVSGVTIRYGTVAIGTVTGGTNGNPLVVTFNSAATSAAVQALVRAITFQAAGTNPNTTIRVASFQVTDGDGGTSDVVTKVISVSQINDPPVLTLSTTVIPPNTTPVSQVTYNANTGSVILDSLATVSDPDTLVFNGGRLTVSLISGASSRDRLTLVSTAQVTVSGTNVSFGGVVVGRLTPGVAGAAMTVDFNTAASIESVQAVVRAVTFQIIGVNPTSNDRIASFQLSDGTGAISLTQPRRIIVQVANLPPVNTVPLDPVVTQEDVSVAITGLSTSDPDASLLPIRVTLIVMNGTITVNTSVSGGVNMTDVSGNGTSRVELFANQDEINATLQSLNGVLYRGNSNYFGADQLTMLTSDLGNSGPGGVLTDSDVVEIEITEVIDSAKITPSASIAKNTKGAEALIDSSITATLGDDQESLAGAILQVNVGAGRNRSDRFRLMTEGKGAGQINTVTGKKNVISVRIGTLVIGTISGGENGKPLKIVFNANATAADLQHILRRITFRTAVQTTVYGMRTITYDFTGSDGQVADQATKQLNVVRP